MNGVAAVRWGLGVDGRAQDACTSGSDPNSGLHVRSCDATLELSDSLVDTTLLVNAGWGSYRALVANARWLDSSSACPIWWTAL